MLADLHPHSDSTDARQFNLLSNLYSKGAGKALDRWVCRWTRWLVVCNIASLALRYIFRSSLATRIVVVLAHLLFVVPWALCLRVSVVKSLLKVAGVWYYLLSIGTGQLMTVLIYGPTWWGVGRDADARAFTFCLVKVVRGVFLINCSALGDAAPSRTLPRPVRLFVLVFIAIYKSGLCASIMSCCASSKQKEKSAVFFTPPARVCTGTSQPRQTRPISTAPIMSLN